MASNKGRDYAATPQPDHSNLEQHPTEEEKQLLEVEKAGDEEAYDEHFRKTFITENKKKVDGGDAWSLHDILIPQGQKAKLIRVPDPNKEEFRASEVADRLKFIEPTPVVVLAGA